MDANKLQSVQFMKTGQAWRDRVMKHGSFVLTIVLLAFAGLAAAPVGQVVAQVDTLAVVATPTSGQTVVGGLAALVAALTPIVGFLVSIGVIQKYVPLKWLTAIPNLIIPFLGTATTFFLMFSGPAPAHAGILGTFIHELPWWTKWAASAYVGGILPHNVYEAFIRGTLERYGIFKSGMTPAEKAAKIKVVGGE